jgi:hypothetical protein
MRHAIWYSRPFAIERPFRVVAFFHGRANGSGFLEIGLFLVAMIIFFGVIVALNRSGDKNGPGN